MQLDIETKTSRQKWASRSRSRYYAQNGSTLKQRCLVERRNLCISGDCLITASEVVVTAISMPKCSISQFCNLISCLSCLLCKYVCNGNPAADSCNDLHWLQNAESHNSEPFILKCTAMWWLSFRETSYLSQLAAAVTTLFQLFCQID